MKRLFDLLISFSVFLALWPVLLALALVVRIKLGSPVFFSQKRPGLNGRSFTLLKFRTMADLRGADGKLKSDAERLLPFGRWLRETSLDELPELWNILKGDMSFVGPRPLLVEYLDRYTNTEARRHEVRPGLTGWAQVNGRNEASWEKRLALDVWYVDHRSFWLDLRIMGMTMLTVLRRDGINAPGVATMPEFRPPSRQS